MPSPPSFHKATLQATYLNVTPVPNGKLLLQKLTLVSELGDQPLELAELEACVLEIRLDVNSLSVVRCRLDEGVDEPCELTGWSM